MRVESPGASAAVGSPAPRTLSGLNDGLRRGCQWLLDQQAKPGYWAGELEADTTLESDYILFYLWLHPPEPDGVWRLRTWDRIQEAARYIHERQSPTGGWSIYPGGPDNISASVKAYFALKLAGDEAGDPHMRVARERILALGGVEQANSYTRLYLSFFGLWDLRQVPTIPPELILLGPSAYINIYEMSSWTRAILVPLSLLCSRRPRWPVPAGFTLDELRTGVQPDPTRGWSWTSFFWKLDGVLKLWERSGFFPHRRQAVRAAERWILHRLEKSDGLGAIFPSMLNSILGLCEIGYRKDHPVVQRAIRQFEDLAIREHGTLRMQPCFSPVWDTALAAFALGLAGSDSKSLTRAADWLLEKEVRERGDWAVKNRHAEPGGWYFEFANEFYPDIDDTAMVLLTLRYARASRPAAQREAEKRAVDWIISMQSKDGGWAAFDKDNDRWILTQVPFADHNAMLDPTCADVTGRVLEALCAYGLRSHPAVRRGVEYLLSVQEADGSWLGRWGVNYIYGTCFALRGLRAAGVSNREARVLQAGEWIRSFQNGDGGWGETPASYDDPYLKGAGDSTASQTAWALMGLFASGDAASGSVQRGVQYLLEKQRSNGRWEEPWFTGTGFPRVFYLKYHLYAQYFPLMALAEYAALRGGAPQ
jgi:squalene-hopene/tetraprenyl-beta-curcumene cyclase